MSMKMPTAQSSSTSSSSQNTNKPKTAAKNVDNKIAKAAAKVAAERSGSGSAGSQENTRATTPDQGQQQQQPAQQQTTAGGGIKTPQEQPEFIKQSLIVIEKKVRNLEKRRTKLEEYRDIQAKGTPLNEDQLAAISRYDEVLRTLELARELEKQFIGLATDAMKQQKKQLKKEQIEREEAVREKLKESQKILALLNTFGDDAIRNDFLNELNGATKLSEFELNALDEFNKIVQPASELNARLEAVSGESAEHLYNLIEAKNKQIAQLSVQVVGAAFTYADLKKLFDRIFTSTYWQQREFNLANTAASAATESSPVETEQPQQQTDTQQQQLDAQLSEQIGQLNMNIEQQSQQNDVHHHSNIPLEQVYHQQNTSEDYILVSAQSDVSGGGVAGSGDSAGQNKQSRTFFSTLNPQDRNINEFLNRENNEEGINFLQDSEIQQQPQQQQQHQVHEQVVEHHQQQQQAPHQHQQHADSHHSQGGQNYQQYQEFGQSEHYKDSRGPRPQRDYNGPRNQHQQNNGNYPPQQQRPRYQDGGPRRGGGQNGGMPNQQPRGNDNRNGGGYRGGPGNRPGGGMGGGQRTGGGGEYRGGNYSSGPRPQQGGPGGQQQQQQQRYPPRQQQQQQQQVAQN